MNELIFEVTQEADGGFVAEELLAGADQSVLSQAVKDIAAARRELSAIERELSSRLKASA